MDQFYFHTYTVGEPFDATVTSWQERLDAIIGPHSTMVWLALHHPTHAERHAFSHAPVEFAWTEGEQSAFLSVRWIKRHHRRPATVSGIPWQETSFSIHRQPASTRALPGEYGDALLCPLILIDAANGLIDAIRAVSWPSDAADAVRRSIQRQLDRSYNADAEQRFIRSMHATYPTAEALVDNRADLRWKGAGWEAIPGGGAEASTSLD
ncbi:hypothetical protein [Haloglycomyces albus]|uniref:hypothetical protein n=1 Tax=Haloglycomyces albus TaxID=526067 RepID=UPI00046CA08A|nr:hypothetical protein [Haloglycomyces albus]